MATNKKTKPVLVRKLPKATLQAIEAAAKVNGRSRNSEIVAALSARYVQPEAPKQPSL